MTEYVSNVSKEELIFGINNRSCNFVCLLIKNHIIIKRAELAPFSEQEFKHELCKRVIVDKH